MFSDIVRIDHFRGFAGFWAVNYGEKTAINGEWYKAYGDELFAILEDELGRLPIIAEDLGVITADVTNLRDKYCFPGMKILQFAFDSLEESSQNFLPFVYDKNCIVYTGTHDNSTALGWYNEAKEEDKALAKNYLAIRDNDISWGFIRGALSSTAVFSIIPLQDILKLDNSSRMNIPGSSSGNWQWRFKKGNLTDKIALKLKKLTKLYGR